MPVSAPRERTLVTIDAGALDRALVVAAIVALATAVALLPMPLLVAVVVSAAFAFTVKSWHDNEVSKDLRTNLADAWRAAIWAMGENGISYGEGTVCGATEAVVEGRDARIRIERHPGSVSRVRIRVGRFALAENRRREALLLESILRNLGQERGGTGT
jgi:hypothetical protein